MPDIDARDIHFLYQTLMVNRVYLRDIYARELFEDERDNNPHTKFDRTARWIELPQGERDIYRRLASKLVEETVP